MYRFLCCKTYKYLYFNDLKEYGIKEKENYDYCETIEWNDHEGKLEMYFTELPYYHPYWVHKVKKENMERGEYLKKIIKERETPRPGHIQGGKTRKEIHLFKRMLKEHNELMKEIYGE